MYPNGNSHHHHHSQNGSQQPPRSWDPNAPPPPPNAQYPGQPPLAHINGQYPLPPHAQTPGHQLRPDRPEMAAIHQQQSYQHPHPPQDPYRLPAPSSFYPGPSEAQYRPAPQPAAQQQGQSAPRQRTAIACKYCRRRKIRCSGFENSEDGRCSNCVRFSQECVFTPVSAQTQAFVPAQALYNRGRGAPPPQQLYGAYGQRLPEGYPPAPPPQQGYPLPSPSAAYPPHAYPPPQHYHPSYDANAAAAAAGRRRGRDEPHTPTLPPPNPGLTSAMGSRPEDAPSYHYPDPSGYGGPAHSPAGAYPPAPQPYYNSHPQPARRSSPGSAYTYGSDNRDSSSPHASNYSYSSGHAPTTSHAHHPSGPTPPPSTSRPGMSISDMVSDSNSGERSAADSDMVGALNRHRR